ncbi:MAG TPA: hypothetical protein PLD62_05460 [Candidatus Cloacimonadota bacterium]|nr:hypothetical protein [Candidatus Cloacimonadota bacterium]
MRKIFIALLGGMILFSLTGCFQTHRLIQVNKDGSGTITETVLIATSLGGAMGGNFNYYDQGELQKDAIKYGQDVKYVSSQEKEKADLKGYEVIYSFSDISQVKIPSDPTEEMMSMGEKSEADDYISFNFKKGKTSEITVIFPPEEEDEEFDAEEDEPEEKLTPEEQEEAIDQIKQIYQNMEISTKIRVEGKIADTDADFVQDNEVTLEEIIFSRILEDEKSLEMMTKLDSMEDDALEQNIRTFPGVKMEQKDKITIKFK